MKTKDALVLAALIFNLVVMPLWYHDDQPYDGVDNALRIVGVSEPVSRDFVGVLYDIFPLTP